VLTIKGTQVIKKKNLINILYQCTITLQIRCVATLINEYKCIWVVWFINWRDNISFDFIYV